MLQWRFFSFNRLASCQTLAKVARDLQWKSLQYQCASAPRSFFSIGKHLNFICKLGEHDSKLSEEMCEHSNNKSGGGCVALLKFKNFFPLALVKHAGLFCCGWTYLGISKRKSTYPVLSCDADRERHSLKYCTLLRERALSLSLLKVLNANSEIFTRIHTFWKYAKTQNSVGEKNEVVTLNGYNMELPPLFWQIQWEVHPRNPCN